MPGAKYKHLPKLVWGAFAVIALVAIVVAVLLPEYSPPSREGGRFAVGGPFEMVDTTGQTVTEADLLGKPSVMFFGFTYCPDVCPTTLYDLSEMIERLGPDAEKMNFVFVSVDPERDTPEKLGDYISAFDDHIRGFTGSPEQVAKMAEAYRIYYEKVPLEGGDYTIDHTASVYLMDAEGNFIGTIDYNEDRETAFAKLKRLADMAD